MLKISKNFRNGEYALALKETFEAIDRNLTNAETIKELDGLKEEKKKGEISQAGCTANVNLVVDGKEIYCANAGDSRSILYSNDRERVEGVKVHPLSYDHKPTDQVEMERITKAGGYVSADARVNGSLNLSRAIGDLEHKSYDDSSKKAEEMMITCIPDVTHTKANEISKNLILVMGCDGIWECLGNQTIGEYYFNEIKIKKQTPLEAIEKFLDLILAVDTSCRSNSSICIDLA